MSTALSQSMRRTPGGVGSETGPLTRTTSAPAFRAACATAKPIFPELRLLMKRTGSMRSRVGPAVISTRLPLSGPVGSQQRVAASIDELQRLEHAALADFAAGLIARCRAEHAARLRCGERGDVGLRGRVRPHHAIHGRRHGDGRFRRETQRGEQVVRLPRGEPRQEVRGGGRDDHEIRPAGELDVPHGGFGRGVPQIRAHGACRRPPGRSVGVMNSQAERVITTCTSAPRSRSRRTRSGLL